MRLDFEASVSGGVRGPTQAAEERIEGWVHGRFTVKADDVPDVQYVFRYALNKPDADQ